MTLDRCKNFTSGTVKADLTTTSQGESFPQRSGGSSGGSLPPHSRTGLFNRVLSDPLQFHQAR